MRVAVFQFFPPTLWTPGGGETQLSRTCLALEKAGVEVIKFDIWNPQKDFDLLHVFGSTYQLSDFVVTAKRLGMKVVVSPIAYSYKPKWQWVFFNVIDKLLPIPTIYSYRKQIYGAADLLLSGSKAEAEQLKTNFKLPGNKFRIVYNAADSTFAEATSDKFVEQYNLNDFVLMVGRISEHKGQLRLIQALEGTGLKLVIIGHPDPDDMVYYERFQYTIQDKPWIHFLGSVQKTEGILASAYAAAKVHALPSLSECPGLVNLEAGLAGANVVTLSNPSVYEHLGDHAWYCNPRSVDSIRDAVTAAHKAPRQMKLRERLLKDFTWDAVAKRLINVYSELV